jgi:MSHA biogenesis protein MshJ
MKGAKTSSINSAKEISDKKERMAKEVKMKKDELEEVTKNLISPQEMAQVLHDMLQTIPNLSLVKMENLTPVKFQSKEDSAGVQQVVQVAVPKKSKSKMESLLGQKDQEEQQALATTEKQTLDEAGQNNEGGIHFYKHGLSLEFSGQFFSTVLYLKMIENLAVNFIWDSLEYDVKDHPGATIKLIVRTLSRDKGVIGD